MSKFCSIIMTHFAMNEERSDLLKESINSLVEHTKYPYELIVIDNRGSEEDTKWLVEHPDITVYVKNQRNMHFAFARNQGVRLSHGDYICIVDNDLIYKEGWLTECVEVLEAFPDRKIYATPMSYPMKSMSKRYHQGYLHHKDKAYELNMRAGSNCFVMRRKDYLDVGDFPHHRIGGSRWTDKAVKKGYLACVVPDFEVEDVGLRRGYNIKETLDIKKILSDGTEIYFNEGPFRERNKGLNYYENYK